ncbi:MAG: ATP phosphoribosyltransferase regulatory subunit [Acidimicrobiia bacterium]|nr:ATP phosphoribosyltransferase regulatory subunit [Acidimicrobiia bacterium]
MATPSQPFRAPTGTRDVLPPESGRWERLVATFAGHVERAGYRLIQSPLFEDVGVFQRMGEGTDVVRKEMYDFRDKGDRHLALRPEGTASVVRAYVEHRPPTPWKTWYVTPSFRYERPQAGRYRQHHQVGLEAIGSDDPDLDVEVIALLWTHLRDLGLERLRLLVNSMGDAEGRRGIPRRCCVAVPPDVATSSDSPPTTAEDRRPPDAGPRLQATRRPSEAITGAPTLLDSLDPHARQRFERVQAGLDALGIPFEIDPRLVRGLDYYTHTTFEFEAPGPRRRPGHHRRWRSLRRARRGARRSAHTGHRLRFGHRARPAGLRRRGRPRRPTSRAVDVFVVDVAGGAVGPRPHLSPCAGAGIRRTGPSTDGR